MSRSTDRHEGRWYENPWFVLTVTVMVIAGLCAVAVAIWNPPIVNAEALRKARELHDKATEMGYDVPSVRQLARLYGVDGGAAAEFAVSDITKALFALDDATTGEVNQRSILIDEVRLKALKFEWLVLGVYRPEVQAEYQEWVDRLKAEGKIPD